jgi:uncharacterized protein YndB with AHSA1/START domain
MAANNYLEAVDDREIHLTRLIDAPRDFAFSAWTDPEHIRHWWGSNPGDTTPDLDVKPGGYWSVAVETPDGRHWFRGVFQEVVPTERLKFSFVWHGPSGHRSPLTNCTLGFDKVGGRTRLTFHQTQFHSKEERDTYLDGWNYLHERYEAYLTEVLHAQAAA